jgi:hypothetical protein
MRKSLQSILIGVLLSYSVRGVSADPILKKLEPNILKGLEGVYVVTSPSDAGGLDVQPADLKTAVELQLRKAAISVFSEEDVRRLKDAKKRPAILMVTIAGGTPPGEKPQGQKSVMVKCIVRLYEAVRLERDPATPRTAIIWYDSGWEFCRDYKPSNALDFARTRVDAFVNDYLEANPK